MVTSGIYKITCKPTRKCYVGSSIEIETRFGAHKSRLKQNKHWNPYLQYAWNKYGEKNFDWQILEIVDNPILLIKAECRWFKITNCKNRNFGFNISHPEERMSGYKHTELPSMTDLEVIQLYTNKKLSCNDIAIKDGRSASTIYKILLKNKVKLRNRSEVNKIFDDCILKFMYNLGLSLSQIAELLGIHPTTISKRFTILDFPTRISCQARGVKYTKEEFKRFFMNDKFKELIQGG